MRRKAIFKQEKLLIFQTDFTVEWGDCDEAGIAFYPNFFYWFDCTFQRLLRSKALSQREMRRRFGAVTPLIDVGARFRYPVRYDDILHIDVSISSFEERRFRIEYDMTSEGRPVGQGHELRAWALVADDGSIKGATIDQEFVDLFTSQ